MSEQGTRPGDTVADTNARWASGVLADYIPNLPSGDKDVGWTDNSIPPNEVENSIARSVYEWLEYFDQNNRSFDSLQDFVATASEGAVALVDEYDNSADFFRTLWPYDTGGNPFPYAVRTDGERVYLGMPDGTLRALDRTTGALLWTQTFPLAAGQPVREVSANGDAVFCYRGGTDQQLYRIIPGDGSIATNVAIAGVVRDVYADGQRVWVVGSDVDGTDDVVGYDRINLLKLSWYDFGVGESAWSVRSDGRYLWVATSRLTLPLDGICTKLRIATAGAHTLVDTYTNAFIDGRAVCLTEDAVVLGTTVDAGNSEFTNVRALPKKNMAFPNPEIWFGFQGGADTGDANDVCFTGRHIVVAQTFNDAAFGEYTAYRMADGKLVEELDFGSSAGRTCDSDGLGLFIGGDASGTISVWRLNLLVKPTLVRRMNDTDELRTPWHKAALPCRREF